MNNHNSFIMRAEKLKYLYAQLAGGIVAIVFIAIIIFFSYKEIVDTTKLYIWISLLTALIIMRLGSLIVFKKAIVTEQNISKYSLLFSIPALLTSSFLGASAFFIFPDDIEHQMILILLVFGLVSGATISFAANPKLFYVYMLTAVTPYAYILSLPQYNISIVFSIAMISYIISISILASKVSPMVINNIQLALKNSELVDSMKIKVEQANSANKAKSDFLSVMSHEIRTPLNAILGFVQILLKSETDDKKKKYLNTISKSSKILTNIINDILDLSKIESGKFALEFIHFNPREEFSHLFTLYEQNARDKELFLTFSISDELPNSIEHDVLRLKQIIGNLLSNAIKFTPKGKNIYLSIDYDRSHESLSCQVRDEGIGIQKDKIEYITQAFTQADSSTARQFGGTGLGLSIIKELLRLMDSQLIIESELGKGSSFSFSINAKEVESQESVTEEKVTSFEGVKILVAEDNKTNQMLISLLLKDLDIEVQIANNGQEAETMFKESPYDLVLMDINMPIKNGTEAMLEIKGYQKSHKSNIPIVALTANALSGDKKKYIEEGFDDYLSKPIDDEELQELLIKYLH